jgi:hypothetical protein
VSQPELVVAGLVLEVPADGRIRGDRGLADQLQGVLAVQAEERHRVSGVGLPLQLDLRVVVARGDGEARRILIEEEGEEEVDVRAAVGPGDAQGVGDRRLQDEVGVVDVDLHHPVVPVGLRAAALHVHHSANEIAVVGG